MTYFDYSYHRWDAFNQTEDAGGSASEKHTDLIKKASYCLKITTALLTFCVVLVAACVSKGALFFMIAQIRIPSNINETELTNLNNRRLQYCPANINATTYNETNYYVNFGETQSIAWMW